MAKKALQSFRGNVDRDVLVAVVCSHAGKAAGAVAPAFVEVLLWLSLTVPTKTKTHSTCTLYRQLCCFQGNGKLLEFEEYPFDLAAVLSAVLA